MTSSEPRLVIGDGEDHLLSNTNAIAEAERLARNKHNGLLNWAEKLQRECR